MPVSFKNPYTPEWNGYPPHMAREDYIIFQRAKTKLFQNALTVYYDAGLGGPADYPDDAPPELKKMWTAVTQKRIDVLIDTGSEWHMVEIRPRATSTAAGRLLQYRDLWQQQPPDTRPLKLILLTDIPDPDLPSLLTAIGIQLMTA